jgi:phage terminase large subunit GpA-like protein
MKPFTSSPASLDALDNSINLGLRLLIPPPALKVSEWADSYAYLPAGSAEPGRWVTATAEYQRGLMDAFVDPDIETIIAMWAAQTGKSACFLNVIGYFCDQDPSHIMLVQPTIDDAEKFSKDRVAKMISETPRLRGLFASPRSRDSNNTLLHKEFPGGFIRIAGANAPSGLASTPVRIGIGDEVDKYPASAGTEGDPIELLEKRLTTYWNRKKGYSSTPNIKHESRIEFAFEISDKRYYYVPCPHCGELQVLRWENLRWPNPENGASQHEPDKCFYICSPNGCEILEESKFEMVRHGGWVATAKSLDGRTAGFHLNALYSPWLRWSELIHEFLRATKVAKEQRNTELLKTFVNARLADTWELRGDRADESELAKHKSEYDAEVPTGALVLAAGVDTQDDRLEVEIVGWGMGSECWSIEYKVLRGDPGRPWISQQEKDQGKTPSVWNELDDYLAKKFRHASGLMLPIRATFIDSGGHHTKQVYDFTRKRATRWIFACKGVGGPGHPLTPPRASILAGKRVPLWLVGTDAAKEAIYSNFKVEEIGPGFCHWPSGYRNEKGEMVPRPEYDQEYFLGITAEELVEEPRPNGASKRVWKKRRERNEPLDCRVYALAALDALRPNFEAIAKTFNAQAEAAKKSKEQPTTPQNLPNRSKTGYVNSWRLR